MERSPVARMEPSDLILLVLGEKGRVIAGRTALQKLAYFASFGVKLDLGYKAHYYGPYSSGVASATEFLVQTDFIREDEEDFAPGYTQYSYSLTEDGAKVSERLSRDHPEEAERIRSIVQTCENETGFDISTLSWAAKTHFLLRRDPDRIWTLSDLMKQGKEIGWEIDEQQIRKGADLLFALNFVKQAKTE